MLTLNILGKDIEVVIDTGFNGGLSLPKMLITNLGLRKVGVFEYFTADGRLAKTEAFSLTIFWMKKERKVDVISSDSDLGLLGMELLHEARIVMEPSREILLLEAPGHG